MWIRRLPLALLLLALAAPLPAAARQAQEDELASPKLRIDWTAFKKRYDAGDIVVIDVRSRDAFVAGHVPGARSVPLEEVERRASELKKLGKPLVLYCA